MKSYSAGKLVTYRDRIHRSTSDEHFKKDVSQKKPFKKRFENTVDPLKRKIKNRILVNSESKDMTDNEEEYEEEYEEETDEEYDEEDMASRENDSSTASAAKSNQKTNTLNDNAATETFKEPSSQSTLDNGDNTTTGRGSTVTKSNTSTRKHSSTADVESTATSTGRRRPTDTIVLSSTTDEATATSAIRHSGTASEQSTTTKSDRHSSSSSDSSERYSSTTSEQSPTSSEQASTTTEDIITISTSLLPTSLLSNISSTALASITSGSVYSSTRLFTSDTLTSSSAVASSSSIAVDTNIPVGQKDNTSAIAGGVLGGIVSLAIVTAVSSFLFKRAQYNRKEKNMQIPMAVPINTKDKKSNKKKETIQVEKVRGTAAATDGVRTFVPPAIGSNVPPYNEEFTLHPYAHPYTDESYYYHSTSAVGTGYLQQVGGEYYDNYGYQSPNHNEYYSYPDIGETNYVDNGYYNNDGNTNLVGTESNVYKYNEDSYQNVRKPNTKG
ncbi:hypothetical protein HPULCUR_009678 [Helicostylum pulchrum]|uniref:Uncharacterized protein n=1 Tax=Helicostylum pulchrum TaxID=562976 RepID=A0ABP9YB52_9FUNG